MAIQDKMMLKGLGQTDSLTYYIAHSINLCNIFGEKNQYGCNSLKIMYFYFVLISMEV